MKRTKRLILCGVLSAVLCGSCLGGALAQALTEAEGVLDGRFEGINVKVNADLTDYRTLKTGEIADVNLTDKYIAFRYQERSNLSGYEIEPKISIDGKELSKDSSKEVYYVGANGVVNSAWQSWSIKLGQDFDGWIVFEAGAFQGEDMQGNMQFSIGMHKDWTGRLDADFGAITAFSAPSSMTYEGFFSAIQGGETLYDFADLSTETGLNEANVYEFGTDDVTISRTVSAQPEKTEAGYFSGINVKIGEELTTYRSLNSGTLSGLDLTGKYLALRLYKRGEGGEIDFKIGDLKNPDGKAVSLYYLDEEKKSVEKSEFWWSVQPKDGFNGWVILAAAEMTGELKGDMQIKLGFDAFSKLLNIDVGSVAVISEPENKTYLGFKNALERGSVVYDFASDTALNAQNEYIFGADTVSLKRVCAGRGMESSLTFKDTQDGYFDGLNLKIEEAIEGDDYYSLSTPQLSGADLTDKYLAFRLYERSGLKEYTIEPKISELSMPADNTGIAVFYMDLASSTVRESRTWWDIKPGANFNGWVVLDAGSMEGNLTGDKSVSFGFASWAGLLDADFGAIVAFDKPRSNSFADFEAALSAGTELYTFAEGEENLSEDFTWEFGDLKISMGRVKEALEIIPRPSVPVGTPVDGYFEGMNISFETLTDYRSIGSPALNTIDLAGKYLAIQIADKTNLTDYQIDVKISGQTISDATVYYVNIGRGRVTTGISPWSVSIAPAFMGYIVIDCSTLSKELLEGDFSMQFGFHKDFSSLPDIDFGVIEAIDTPETFTVQGFSSALEKGTILYDFAESPEIDGINPLTVFDFAEDEVIVSRAHKTLGIEDLPPERMPAYCETVGDTKVMNFQLNDTDALSDFVGNAEDYPECTFSLTERANDETGSGGKALHVKLGASTGFQHSAIEVKPRGYGAEMEANAKGLTFFIKNYQDSGFFINIGFDLGQRWVTKWDGDYAIYQLWNTETGKESTHSGASEGLYIPANFEGYVRVAFEQFHAANWVAAPMEWEEAVAMYSAVTYLSIDVNTDAYAGYEFDIDNIGWYYGEAVAKNLFLDFSDGKPSIAEFMKRDDYFEEE